VEDLVAAAPNSGWNWTAVQSDPAYPGYAGHLQVYFGSRTASGKPFNAVPDVIIESAVVRNARCPLWCVV
jgi:hypothetical protein